MIIIRVLLVCHVVYGFFYPILDPTKLYSFSPPEDDVTFYLYNFRNLSTSDQIVVDDQSSVHKSRFDPDLDTKVLIHGWSHHKDVPWLIELREAMANKKLWNIIVVDWGPLSHVIYVEARVHFNVVSKQVARMLFTLYKSYNIQMSSIHIIGHSMGAQIAGFAGLKIHETISQKVGRITGLDPAGPMYEWPHMESLDELLDPSDANFVDVIHTNGGRIGTITPAGHLDYYPNGGERQPGCYVWACSHMRAVEYWIASIKNPHLFKAFLYNEWRDYLEGHRSNLDMYPMGILADSSFPSGTYYLETYFEYLDYVTSETTLIDSYV